MSTVDEVPFAAGLLAASVGSIATDELEALVVALVSLAVREVIWWLRHRRKPKVEVVK